MKKDKRLICFAGLLSDTNLGDVVILESTEGLYKTTLKAYKDEVHCSRMDLQYKKTSFPLRIIRKIKRIVFHKLKRDINRFEINMLKKHYQKQLGNAGLIVVVGGGIVKYKYQSFHLFLTAIIELAEEMNIPVILNAVGVEGYSESDASCQLLKVMLNKRIVKSITTRDDFETLSLCYMDRNNKKHLGKVADSAVYCDEIYKQNKRLSNTYGIGLVRGGIFLDNERNLGPEKIVEFYASLILEMESRNLNYQLFTNGLPVDGELILQVEAKLGGRKIHVIEPKEDAELIKTIASFTTVIAARLHANIISYALDVPSIGLVWNDKLALFGEDIGYPGRFFEYNQLDAKKIVDAAVLANEQGYDQQHRNEYRKTAKDNINYLVQKWLRGEL